MMMNRRLQPLSWWLMSLWMQRSSLWTSVRVCLCASVPDGENRAVHQVDQAALWRTSLQESRSWLQLLGTTDEPRHALKVNNDTGSSACWETDLMMLSGCRGSRRPRVGVQASAADCFWSDLPPPISCGFSQRSLLSVSLGSSSALHPLFYQQ